MDANVERALKAGSGRAPALQQTNAEIDQDFRLLLLSRSSLFPHGLANGSDLVGRNATFHEYSAAVGVFDDLIYSWAGGGYVAAKSHRPKRWRDFRADEFGMVVARPGIRVKSVLTSDSPSYESRDRLSRTRSDR